MKFLILVGVLALVAAETPVSKLVQGKFSFVSQENFEEYLSAAGVESEKIKVLTGLKPDALVENKGNDHFTITFIVGPSKNRTIDFILGEVYEVDFIGTGQVTKSLTTLENGDTFATIDPENLDIKRWGKFTETEMIMTLQGNGVNATRIFERID